MLELLLAICLAGGGRGLLRGPAELAPRVNRLLGTDLTLGAAELSRRLAMVNRPCAGIWRTKGTALRELREHCRLERALALVQTSSLPIGQVAEACDYASASRFSARFRSRFGCTPQPAGYTLALVAGGVARGATKRAMPQTGKTGAACIADAVPGMVSAFQDFCRRSPSVTCLPSDMILCRHAA